MLLSGLVLLSEAWAWVRGGGVRERGGLGCLLVLVVVLLLLVAFLMLLLVGLEVAPLETEGLSN